MYVCVEREREREREREEREREREKERATDHQLFTKRNQQVTTREYKGIHDRAETDTHSELCKKLVLISTQV